jgi:hypothetical protein
MNQHQLTDEELEQLAVFGLGLAFGFVLFCLLARLVEEWVIASDQADRQRIREIVREMLDAAELGHEKDERAWSTAIVSTPRPLTPKAAE